MAINIYGIKDAANVIVIKKSTSKPIIRADYATTSENTWTSEQVYAMSKNTKAIRWDHTKESTIKMSMEIFDLKWLSMLSGSDFVTGSTNILVSEILTVGASNTANLSATPVTGSLSLFKLDSDNLTHLNEQTLGEPSTTQDTYSVANVIGLTFNATSCPDTTKVVAYYLKASAVTSKKMTILSTAFPYSVELYLDTMIRDTDGNDSYVQLHYPNCKARGNFNISLSAKDITKLDVEFDIFKESTSDTMATYTII